MYLSTCLSVDLIQFNFVFVYLPVCLFILIYNTLEPFTCSLLFTVSVGFEVKPRPQALNPGEGSYLLFEAKFSPGVITSFSAHFRKQARGFSFQIWRPVNLFQDPPVFSLVAQRSAPASAISTTKVGLGVHHCFCPRVCVCSCFFVSVCRPIPVLMSPLSVCMSVHISVCLSVNNNSLVYWFDIQIPLSDPIPVNDGDRLGFVYTGADDLPISVTYVSETINMYRQTSILDPEVGQPVEFYAMQIPMILSISADYDPGLWRSYPDESRQYLIVVVSEWFCVLWFVFMLYLLIFRRSERPSSCHCWSPGGDRCYGRYRCNRKYRTNCK